MTKTRCHDDDPERCQGVTKGEEAKARNQGEQRDRQRHFGGVGTAFVLGEPKKESTHCLIPSQVDVTKSQS